MWSKGKVIGVLANPPYRLEEWFNNLKRAVWWLTIFSGQFKCSIITSQSGKAASMPGLLNQEIPNNWNKS